MYISLITYRYKEMRKIISITHVACDVWRYIDMIILIIILWFTMKLNKRTDWHVRSRSAYAFYTSVGGGGFFCGVKSGPRTRVDRGWQVPSLRLSRSEFVSLRLSVQARWRANIYIYIGVRYLSGKAFLASEKGPEGRVFARVRYATMSFSSRMMIVRLFLPL